MSQVEELPPLSGSLGYVLKQATASLHASMEAVLRPVGLTLSQYSCLELLSRGGDQTNAQLARGAFVTPQSMHELLLGLERRALVRREADSQVGRARPAHPTDAGLDLVERARIAIAPIEQALVAGLSDADQAALLARLHAIVQALDPSRRA